MDAETEFTCDSTLLEVAASALRLSDEDCRQRMSNLHAHSLPVRDCGHVSFQALRCFFDDAVAEDELRAVKRAIARIMTVRRSEASALSGVSEVGKRECAAATVRSPCSREREDRSCRCLDGQVIKCMRRSERLTCCCRRRSWRTCVHAAACVLFPPA